jgi:hypothetical protein
MELAVQLGLQQNSVKKNNSSISISSDHHIRQLAVFASTTQLCRAPLQSLRQGEDAPVGQNGRVIVSKAETGLILAPGSARVPRR